MITDKPPVIAQVRQVKLPRSGYICERCGEVNATRKSVVRGSFIIEILLWCMLIVPGLIYTIWRNTTRSKVCRDCGGQVFPIRSPSGRLLAQQFNPHVTVVP